jgi:hypothetical protein
MCLRRAPVGAALDRAGLDSNTVCLVHKMVWFASGWRSHIWPFQFISLLPLYLGCSQHFSRYREHIDWFCHAFRKPNYGIYNELLDGVYSRTSIQRWMIFVTCPYLFLSIYLPRVSIINETKLTIWQMEHRTQSSIISYVRFEVLTA